MQTNVRLPQLELTMEQVVVTKVLVKVGDIVSPEQPIIEVETQKATSDVPSPAAGHVRHIAVKPGDTLSESALLCILTETSDEAFECVGATPASPAAAKSQTPAEAAVAPAGAVKASPAARRVARELGVDLSNLAGTGPGGRITEDDVRAAGGDGWTPLSPSRAALIAQMQRSLAEIPQFHVSRRIDVTPLTRKIDGASFTERLILATGRALAAHPILRTVLRDSRTKVEPVSVAVAMDTPHGLIAPAIRKPDVSPQEISQIMRDLRARAEAGTLRREELIDAPFAISNLGMFGIDQFTPFVFHGQTAVLAVGRATDVADGRKLAWFTLAADHRVVDGAPAARFLQTLQEEILKS